MRLEFGQILSLLMNYCSNHPDITSASSSTSLGFILENTLDGPLDSLCTIFSARDLLHELLLLAVCYIIVDFTFSCRCVSVKRSNVEDIDSSSSCITSHMYLQFFYISFSFDILHYSVVNLF